MEISGGYKATCKLSSANQTSSPDSAWLLQAVTQLESVSFICLFQIAFLFNGEKAFILMESLSLGPERRGLNAIPEFELRTLRELRASSDNFQPCSASESEAQRQGGICISSFLKFSHPLGIPKGRGTTAPVIYWEGNNEKKYL